MIDPAGTIDIHERLATLEAGQLYTNKSLDELKGMLEKHASADCDGNCTIGREMRDCTTSLKTYKRLTWISLCGIIAAGLRAMFPG